MTYQNRRHEKDDVRHRRTRPVESPIEKEREADTKHRSQSIWITTSVPTGDVPEGYLRIRRQDQEQGRYHIKAPTIPPANVLITRAIQPKLVSPRKRASVS